MTNCKYKLRKLSVGLVSVGTMLIAPTVLGQEVNASTETSASSTTSTASTAETSTPTGTSGTAASGASGEATVATANGGPQSAPATSEATPQPQAQAAPAASAPTTVTSSSSSDSDAKTPKAASTTSSSATVASPSNGSNKEANAETAPQMMDVEQYKIKDENSSITVADKAKQLKIRRDDNPKDKDLFDVKREVKDNGDGTLDVTLKVMPKQIDEGADVMALLDVSQKMTKENFDKAKEQIKKMVTTLTGEPTDGKENHNRRNSVRLMTFYRKVSDPIELTTKNVDAKLKEVWDQAKKDWDWGVDLQGAIHKAREIFKKEKSQKKRQHIVLFSQGESTFSYDIHNKSDSKILKTRVNENITTSNPLFPWLPIFNHTNRKADMIDDVKYLIKWGEKLGIEGLNDLDNTLKLAGAASGIVGVFLGGGSLTEYLSLKEYQSDRLNASQFNYERRVGEGYYYHSFSERKTAEMPNRALIKKQLEGLFKGKEGKWFKSILEKLSLTDDYQKAKEEAILKVLDYFFYKRDYIYYNHNLSAIAEAKMAQQEGVTFYSVDVTDFNSASKRAKRQVKSEEDKKKAKEKENIEKKRDEKFDNYLKQMSEGGKEFFNDVDKAENFKDTLTSVTVTETFGNNVSVESGSWKTSLGSNSGSSSREVSYKGRDSGRLLSLFGSTKESLTWTISKDQLKQAFEEGKPLTLTYKLKVDKDKFRETLKKQQESRRIKKRAASSESENTVTETIISNKISYKINNDKDTNNNKLEEVKMSYSKFKMPIPELDIEVVVPKVPEKPLVEPMTPLYPAIPNYPTPQLPKDEDLEISGGHGPIVDIVEDTGTGVEGGAQNGVVSTQENKDPIVDITEDTQPGMSGSNDATVVEEDTTPQRPDVLVGGQSDPIDITEDTQPGMSGSNDATVVEEDTVPKRPDILVGGQSDPIDITEDTQPGMSGSNDATVIEEDTKPKRFFHFDNEPQAPEKPKEQPSLSLPQAPVYKAAHHLPASGDKREASFTIVALTIIGAAGLLSKKRRDTEEN
ncbi:TPA: serum opacification factor [Streptococcus pyogenes]|nr:fibronectin binding protein [Streptococcus pyogenes]HEP2089979.1 fibronectin binding protein [Streptococcus pyogenes]HEQ0565034.1 fibronectin binding protein [Streptococcus pyogenes]HEQ1097472.1 fibronectin binding protein [Streptococcus pyogenes]HEQ1108377.1 fibronectin binding protein [Streptococcus pyogenes]